MTAPTDVHELFQFYMIRGECQAVTQNVRRECNDYALTAAHETFKRGCDNIIAKLDDPPMDDLPNFLGYCQAWGETIESHHRSEGKSHPRSQHQESSSALILHAQNEPCFPF
jgi:hypothetical protein